MKRAGFLRWCKNIHFFWKQLFAVQSKLTSMYRTETALPNDAWMVILNIIKEDAKVSQQQLKVRLVFLSSVSKQLSSLCKAFKETNKEEQPKPTDFPAYFAANGFLSCLVYAHENQCQWDTHTCSNAALNGHLECLKYAHESGCQWDMWTCSGAALNGHLECLKYAHENGCQWSTQTCYCAARRGHLESLKYAHENGCAWDADTCSSATKNGHLECLKYVHENGCPCPHLMLHFY